MSPPNPRIVILGCGFGGLGAFKALESTAADCQITLVDQHDYHTFQPLLYQVATAELDPADVGFPIRELLHGRDNASFHMSAVRKIDLANKRVELEGVSPPLEYDYLVLAIGAVVNYFHTPGAEQFAFPLYTLTDAVRLKDHILRMCEAVDKNPALADDGALAFAVVGGGPTGVELAGALAELLHNELTADFPNIPVAKARVLLYEYGPNLLPPFLPKLQAYARKALEDRGVEVCTGTGVKQVAADGITLSTGETIPTKTLVWAAGLQANPLAATLGIELVHGGRIPVGPDLQVAGHPGVFAIGDIAAMTDGKTGKVLPGLGATALQAGRHVGESIARLIDKQPPEPFAYTDKGTMAQVGRGAAVAELPFGLTLTGLPAWLAWLGVHLALLSGGQQRSSVFLEWGWNLLTHKRGKRIILDGEDERSA